MIGIGFYVEFESHRLCVASIKHGKKLPYALYVFHPRNEDVSPDIWNMISQAEDGLPILATRFRGRGQKRRC